MIITSLKDFRLNVSSYLEKMKDTFQKVVITSKNENYILMTESEYNSLMETNYLLSTKANRDNLDASIKELSKGKSTTSANINTLFNDLDI